MIKSGRLDTRTFGAGCENRTHDIFITSVVRVQLFGSGWGRYYGFETRDDVSWRVPKSRRAFHSATYGATRCTNYDTRAQALESGHRCRPNLCRACGGGGCDRERLAEIDRRPGLKLDGSPMAANTANRIRITARACVLAAIEAGATAADAWPPRSKSRLVD